MKLVLMVLAVRFLIVAVSEFNKSKKAKNEEEVNSNGVKHPAEFQLRW